MVAAPRALLEAKVEQQRAKIIESDVRIGAPLEDSADELLMLTHSGILPAAQFGVP